MARGGGLHSRTIEVLDQRGVADRFVAAGQISPTLSFAGVPLDISDFPSRHPYVLALWQSHFEPILAEWVDELGVPILRAREVVGFAQDATGVDVELSDGTSLRAEYLVGCDGARSLVRKAAGIAFPGMDPTTSWMIAEVEMDEEPEFGPRPEGGGIGRASDGSAVRVVLMEREVDHEGDPDLDDLRDALEAAYGTDFGVRDAHWISRFTDMTRQAATYRDGRVLLAGDAAHVHPPQGGQGLNTGVQDAVNLGWKLAQVVQGTSPETLLDTYHDERHPVGAQVLRNTVVAVALTSPDERQQAVRAAMVELLGMDEPRRSVAANISGLDIRYDLHDDPTTRTPAGRPAHARPRPRHRRRTDVRLRVAARGEARAPRLRRTRHIRHRTVGGSSAMGRREVRRGVGAPGHRRGRRSPGRPDSTRRARRLGRRTHRPHAPRGPHDLVRRTERVNRSVPRRGDRRARLVA